jgi:hypothetical protein
MSLVKYRQGLIENKKTVTLEDQNFPVRSTAKRNSNRSIFNSIRDLRGLEQDPDPKYRWQRSVTGKKVQFLEREKCVAVVADGKVHLHPRRNSLPLNPDIPAVFSTAQRNICAEYC